jgi:heme A synthase
MPTLRRYSYVAFGVACAHLVSGALERIAQTGTGCGDHWFTCDGSAFPPLNRPDLLSEMSHRYLASILLLSLVAMFGSAWRRRSEPGIAGPGGVLRSSGLAVALGIAVVLFRSTIMGLGNAPLVILAHWTGAMSLVAVVAATVIRAGGLGGAAARVRAVSKKTERGTLVGAAMALVTVVMGGLTAKYPGAAMACPSFPLCGTNPGVQGPAVHIQLTHRVLAVLLVLHLFSLFMGQHKRRESPVILRAATIALSLGVLQLLVAGAMIGMHLPPMLRWLHEATGVSIWIATFVLAYLARVSEEGPGVREPRAAPEPVDLVSAGVLRASGSSGYAFATSLADPPIGGAIEPKEPWQASAEVEFQQVELEQVELEQVELPQVEDSSVAGPPRATSTMSHSIAVIVARGADL